MKATACARRILKIIVAQKRLCTVIKLNAPSARNTNLTIRSEGFLNLERENTIEQDTIKSLTLMKEKSMLIRMVVLCSFKN